MEYSHDYLIHYYEIDQKRRLTLPALIHYFEDIAMLNSSAQGYELSYYDRTNHGFMLIKWDITVYSWPKFNEQITVITQPYAFKRFLANRKYSVVDKEGKLIAEAQSVWLFANTKTRRPDRLPDDMFSAFDISKESESYFEILDELNPVTEGEYKLDVKVQSLDIDTNNHVNNVRYIEWALESLPKDFVQNNFVSRIKVNYKKELNIGDEAGLVSMIKNDGDKLLSHHSIHGGDKDICYLQLQWTKE